MVNFLHVPVVYVLYEGVRMSTAFLSDKEMGRNGEEMGINEGKWEKETFTAHHHSRNLLQ